METHSNWLKVSMVVGLLLTALIGFAFWIIQASDAEGPTYEIRFKQSVAGVQKGSSVKFVGVAVGQVTEVQLRPDNPDLVTVRFVLMEDEMLHPGVKASINRSLIDGSATIDLEGGNVNLPALMAQPGQPYPVIPVKSGGLLGGGSSPTDFIAKLSSATESLSKKLDPAGQSAIESRLEDLARRSHTWDSTADRGARQISPHRLNAIGDALARTGTNAEKLRRRLDASRGELRQNLVGPLRDAELTAETLGQSINRARPKVRQLEDDALKITETVRSLRAPVLRVGEAAQKLERQGLGSLTLPDYRPSDEEKR
ncbi:MAG: MlaD family protein [Pseudomonadota bacterium]